MSLADELLDSLDEDQVATHNIDPSIEPHIIINEDKTIIVPDELKHIAVEGEHNIETVTFDCPRYWDEHDLSEMSMRINYQRPDGHREPSPVENLRVDDADANMIHFDWTISGNVTAVKGNISFMVCAKIADAEGNIDHEWHSRLNQDLIIDEGLECSGDEIVERNPDILESILVRLDTLESTGGNSSDSSQNVELDSSLTQSGKAADAKATGDEIKRVEGKIPNIEGLAQKEDIPTKPEDIGAQPQGNYASPDDIPKVPNWAMQASKPAYTASEVGALPNTYTPPNQTAEQVGADPTGTAAAAVSAHNANNAAHNDIRLLIEGLTTRLNALANSTDTDLDQMAELVTYIKSNKSLIDGITTGKVSVVDIVNNLTTNVANKPLSAAQGVVIKGLIDGLFSGKLDASKLQEAISTALAQAKASGEFDGEKGDPGKDGNGIKSAVLNADYTLTLTFDDGTSYTTPSIRGATGAPGSAGKDGSAGAAGKDGTSVTVKSVSESTADGGSNVVTFSDGKTITIKNGSKGSTGATGATGEKGTDGVSVSSIKQTTTSSADGGSNVVTVTLSNGTTFTFTVKNGSKGSTGSNGTSVTVSNVSESSASGGTNTVTFSDGKKVNIKNGINGTNGTNGKDGKTPVKGTDYWTPADQESIVQDVIAALGTPVFGRVDADNNIILTGNLAEGNSYTVKYEDAEGNVTEVGNIVFEAPPAYTNRLPLAIAADGTPYNGGQGWKTGTRLNSSGAESTSSADGIEVTGFIPVKSGDKIYLSGVTMNLGTKASQTYMWLYDSSFTKMDGRYRLFSQYSGEFDANKANGLIDVDEDGNITMITVDHGVFYTGVNLADISNAAYLRISCEEINNNSIITVNEPIV